MARFLAVVALLLVGCNTDSSESDAAGPSILNHECEAGSTSGDTGSGGEPTCEADAWDDDVTELIDTHAPDGTFASALDIDRRFIVRWLQYECLVAGCNGADDELQQLDRLISMCGANSIHASCACPDSICAWQ